MDLVILIIKIFGVLNLKLTAAGNGTLTLVSKRIRRAHFQENARG